MHTHHIRPLPPIGVYETQLREELVELQSQLTRLTQLIEDTKLALAEETSLDNVQDL